MNDFVISEFDGLTVIEDKPPPSREQLMRGPMTDEVVAMQREWNELKRKQSIAWLGNKWVLAENSEYKGRW
jgi:hypothetical protein